jgi:hypothetical protein
MSEELNPLERRKGNLLEDSFELCLEISSVK